MNDKSAVEKHITALGVHLASISDLRNNKNVNFIVLEDESMRYENDISYQDTMNQPQFEHRKFMSMRGFETHDQALTWVKENINRHRGTSSVDFQVIRVSQMMVNISLT
jgi:hypothetical protein